MPLDWSPLWLSLRYAGLATLFAILVALPLAWLLARRPFPGCELLDAAANLPLVLPPAVLVYYLLAALGRWPLHFSWHAAVVVSAIYTLPLLLRMIRAGLAGVDHSFENAARGLGAGEWRTFWRSLLTPQQFRLNLSTIISVFRRVVGLAAFDCELHRLRQFVAHVNFEPVFADRPAIGRLTQRKHAVISIALRFY